MGKLKHLLVARGYALGLERGMGNFVHALDHSSLGMAIKGM